MDRKNALWTGERKRVAELCPMNPVFLRCLFEYNPHLLEKAAGIVLRRQDLVRKGRLNTAGTAGIRMQDRNGQEIRVVITGEGFIPLRKMCGIVPYDAQRKDRTCFDIRIAENDVFGMGWPVYCCESGGITRLYVNGMYSRESALSSFLHDLRCRSPENMLLPELILTVRYLKESEPGIRRVIRALDEARLEEQTAFG